MGVQEMDPSSWALAALASTAALFVTSYVYRRRETPGQGRRLLAALRWGALTVLILLLFDPELPATGGLLGGDRTRILVDASLSMELPVGPGETETRWQRTAAEAVRLAGRAPVLLFGATARSVPADSLAGLVPVETSSRLLPTLQAASEAGARRVVVLTDGGIEDLDEVRRALPGLRLDLEIRQVGEPVPGRTIPSVGAPAWAEAGKPIEVSAEIGGVGPGDSLTVAVMEGDRVLARTRIAVPGEGRLTPAVLQFTPEASTGGGLVRYEVVLEDEDDILARPRSFYVRVGEPPAGVALVSFRPDWEPRFLHPVLEQALGLPVQAYLAAGNGRYIRVGAGQEAGGTVTEETVRGQVGRANLLVLHGLGPSSPAWAREAVRSSRSVLVFPDAAMGDLGLPVTLRSAGPGEWYPLTELPGSPVASLLAPLPTGDLAPLTDLRMVDAVAGAWSPLQASSGRTGSGSPLVVAGEQGGRRWAVATAQGYWRWAFRGGDSRQAYRRLWSAMAGWLAEETRSADEPALAPVSRSVHRGEPVRWKVAADSADSVAVRLVAGDGTVVLDTIVGDLREGALVTPSLPSGHYRYEAQVFAGSGGSALEASGPLTIEGYSPEFDRPTLAVAGLVAAGAAGGPGGGGPRQGVPFHATPWPYLMLITLLCVEWALRRRWGLR